MVVFCGQHDFEPGPELAVASDHKLVRQVGPLQLHGSLESVDIWVGGGTGLGLNIAPKSLVDW